ncbi:MAG: hypothetical protein DMG06_10305 [Acidobacteria bacterium]|nr:MAG: hypothetical protein DMG06_10305 [Acidobacteriota bacterium]
MVRKFRPAQKPALGKPLFEDVRISMTSQPGRATTSSPRLERNPAEPGSEEADRSQFECAEYRKSGDCRDKATPTKLCQVEFWLEAEQSYTRRHPALKGGAKKNYRSPKAI